MTKNKKIILIIAAAAVVVFFFVIDTIKGIQTNIERNKNATDAEKFIELGAERLGTSRLVKIMKQEEVR